MARWALACLGIALLRRRDGAGLSAGNRTGSRVSGAPLAAAGAPSGPGALALQPLEGSLDPAGCGTCHPVQLADWKTSLHARSMGPGVSGQLAEVQRTDPATARLCLTCHAPLTEQHPVRTLGDTLVANPDFDRRLHQQGLVCAGCHVRNHRRYGPPRRDGTVDNSPGRPVPHAGAVRVREFLRSEFCSSWHPVRARARTRSSRPSRRRAGQRSRCSGASCR